jgi:flagellin
MGLRINNNISSIRALRNLRVNDRNQAISLERLATGLRINRAGDDPAGLVISEQLRAQISSLIKAVDNTQNASNLIGTADAALQEISDLLSGIRDSVVFALNEGASSTEQVAAEQAAVDEAISTITRIANTTRYSDSSLLNGKAGFTVTSANSNIDNLNVRSVLFSPGVSSRVFTMRVETAPTRKRVSLSSPSIGGRTTLRITGSLGTADIVTSTGATSSAIRNAVNGVANLTGVFVSSSQSNSAYAEEYGSDQIMSITVVSGNFNGVSAGNELTLDDDGTDGVISLAGQIFEGVGRHFNITGRDISLEFDFTDPVPAAASNLIFVVDRSGLNFQLNSEAQLTDAVRVGIRNISADALGFDKIRDLIAQKSSGIGGIMKGGVLTSLMTGGDNDLDSDNLVNALRIVDFAINQVSGLRGYLGALQKDTFASNINSLEVAIENLQASESSIRDLDFASETAEFTRTQILFQAGTAVLASANLIPQSVLTLLGGR